MIDKSTKFSLISGVPIYIEKVGYIHPLTLREIGKVTEKRYNEFLSILCLNKNILENRKGVNLSTLSTFDILTGNAYHDENFKKDIEEALAIFLKEKVSFIPEYLIFYVGENVEELRFIHRDNFDDIVWVLKIQNNLDSIQSNDEKELSDKAKVLINKRNKGRKILAKARGQDDISLYNLVASMGVFVKDLNKVLDMTVYQFHNQYEKFMKKENYDNNFEMFLVGADPKKLNLDKHWTS